MKRIAIVNAKKGSSRFRVIASLVLSFLLTGSLVFAFISSASAQIFPPDTDISEADASFIGEDAEDYSGFSVASAGDVNDDGYDDFLIGAYNDNSGGSHAGQTYLILGKLTGWAMNTDLSMADASFIGEDSSDSSGFSVASAGDVNGDGYDDFLIGAPYDDDGGEDAGQTYLILGKEGEWRMDFTLALADASFWGEDFYNYSGYSVAPAGDVNGDGYADFLIGAPDNNDGGSSAGQTYLILGRNEADWGRDYSLSEADASFIGEGIGDESGLSVASAGDVNGDGYADFLIGAPNNNDSESYTGQTYLILGREDADWGMDYPLSGADASFIGEAFYDYSGGSVASAGDVNGDGYDDILIGAYGYDDREESTGKTYLIQGKEAADWGMDYPLSEVNASFVGEDVNDYSGYSVASAGDVNDDGYDDFLIGAHYNNEGGDDAGQTYLMLGGDMNWGTDYPLSEADTSFIGEDAFDYSGHSVAPAGDINGDGCGDIVIGAYGNDDGGDDAGKTYLCLGKGSPSTPTSFDLWWLVVVISALVAVCGLVLLILFVPGMRWYMLSIIRRLFR